MAANVTTFTGEKATQVVLTSVSDGSNEDNVVKVDVSTLANSPSRVRIACIKYDVSGMGVRLQWEATSNVDALILGSGNSQHFDYRNFGGIRNNGGEGVTGNILLSTIDAVAGATYSIVLELENDD